MNYDATGQQMPWVPPSGVPQSFVPRPMDTNVGGVDYNAFGGFPGGPGPAPMGQEAYAAHRQMRAMNAEMHAQAAAWAHVAPPLVVA